LSLTLGASVDTSLSGFVAQVLTTQDGWILILAGNAAGAAFAAVVLAISVVSFPMVIDRAVGPVTAVATSLRVCMGNLRVMAAWGLLIAGALIVGFLTLGVGLAIVFPLLGHATWHLYRRAVV